MTTKALPDVLGYKLSLAKDILAKAGWQWTSEENLPFRVRGEFVRREEDAFVLKVSPASNNICVLLVGYKVRKEV